MKDLTRDEQHVYRYHGKIVPGVTKVMDHTIRDLSKVPQKHLANKREVGELVHEATALDASGALDDETIDPEVYPYVFAWRLFRTEIRPVILSTEEMVYHPTYNYAGALDHRMIIHGHEGIVDKKTGLEDKADAVQLSAYERAYLITPAEPMRPLKRWIVSLKPDGTYRLREYADFFHVFLAALTCYRFKTEGWK